jgi:hypothetical protein
MDILAVQPLLQPDFFLNHETASARRIDLMPTQWLPKSVGESRDNLSVYLLADE